MSIDKKDFETCNISFCVGNKSQLCVYKSPLKTLHFPVLFLSLPYLHLPPYMYVECLFIPNLATVQRSVIRSCLYRWDSEKFKYLL